MGEPGVSEDLGRELRALSVAYAEAADRRDVAAFLEAFAPDGVVEVYRPDGGDQPVGVFRGHDELARVPLSLTRWTSTAHLVGDATYRRDGDDEVSGEVACEAHHLRPAQDPTGGGTTDEVMTIRYHDRYRRLAGRWLVAHRQVRVTAVRTDLVDGDDVEAAS